MLGNNQEVRNRTARSERQAQLQGELEERKYNCNYTATTELKASRSRYDKGMELYTSGRVSIGPNVLFKVSRFEVDTEKMQCECPDYRTRKQTCKHIFAFLLFVKHRRKERIEHLDEANCCYVTTISNGNDNGIKSDPQSKSYPESKHTSNKPQEAHSKDFYKQATLIHWACGYKFNY
jgi:hypothetical protein